MKKIVYYFVAALALVACTPKNGADQVVRIGVSLDDDAQPNQKGQQRISAEDKGSVIEILWEDKDVLYYQLDGKAIDKTNPFKLISGARTKNAFFECENTPEDNLFNQKFTLYYNGAGNPGGEIPFEQFAEANKVNREYIFYSASNCEIERGINLEPNFALLGIKMISDTNLPFEKSIAIGTNFGEVGGAYIGKFTNSIDLNTAPTYYFVMPDGYKLNGKSIILIRRLGNTSSNMLSLPNIELTSNAAKILTIKVTRNAGKPEEDNFAYTIASVGSSN